MLPARVTIMRSRKHNRYECYLCGKPREIEDEFTSAGYCIECGIYLETQHSIDMRDPESVTRKQWAMAERYSLGGRPKNYTPVAGTKFPQWLVNATFCKKARIDLSSIQMVTTIQKRSD